MIDNRINNKILLIKYLIVITGVIYISRLFYIQVVDDRYVIAAENNSTRTVTIYPPRGLIYDRNGELMVYNEPAYDVEFTPRFTDPYDTTLLCDLLHISRDYLRKRIKEHKRRRKWSRMPCKLVKLMSSKDYGRFVEHIDKFPGFNINQRSIRRYTNPTAPHVLGRYAEISRSQLNSKKYRDDYDLGDYIGLTGVEKSYENTLKGKKGRKIYYVDARGRIKGSYKKGKRDVRPVAGKNIHLTVDLDLQMYAEKLMQNKRGSVIAIEPATGEILSFVSSPAYDPGELTGRKYSETFKRLNSDKDQKPLINRGLSAWYPPGSTFKPVHTLVGLQEEIIHPYSKIACHGAYHKYGVRVGCHYHGQTMIDVVESIQYSCNTFYCEMFTQMMNHSKYESLYQAFDTWRDHLISFGLGKSLGIDLPNEKGGYVPSTKYYDKLYKESKGWQWGPSTVVSISIGQGEMLVTPIQMANMTAVIANRGFYVTPHVVKKINNSADAVKEDFKKKKYTKISPEYFEPVVTGMDSVVNGGDHSTARYSSIYGIRMCGKTGTAQNKGEDHSIFIAFAPKYNPQIVVASYIENVGFGSKWAAPVASLIIEKYLRGEVKRKYLENNIMETNLLYYTKPEKKQEE